MLTSPFQCCKDYANSCKETHISVKDKKKARPTVIRRFHFFKSCIYNYCVSVPRTRTCADGAVESCGRGRDHYSVQLSSGCLRLEPSPQSRLWELHSLVIILIPTVEPLIKDTPKEDKPPNKRQAENTLVYILSLLKEDRLLYKGQNGWSHCRYLSYSGEDSPN